jgi:hypothetical protein
MATELFIPIPGQQIPHYTGGLEQISPYFWKKDRFIRICDTTTNSEDKVFSITIKGTEITEQDLEVLDILKRQLKVTNWTQFITPMRVELDLTFTTDMTEDELTSTLIEIYKGYSLLGRQFLQNDLKNMHHSMQNYLISSKSFEPNLFQSRSCNSSKDFINAPDVYVIP